MKSSDSPKAQQSSTISHEGSFPPPRVQTRQSVTIAGMASTKITVNNNGSIRIEGDFSIHDAEGKEFGLGGRTIISLCRCGHSANKPFCDGSHKANGFASRCEARDLPPESLGIGELGLGTRFCRWQLGADRGMKPI